jgi:hypothetical protein
MKLLNATKVLIFLLFFVLSSYLFAWLTYFGLIDFLEHTTFYTWMANNGAFSTSPIIARIILIVSLPMVAAPWFRNQPLWRAFLISFLGWGVVHTVVEILAPHTRRDGLLDPYGIWYGQIWTTDRQTQYTPQFTWEAFSALPKNPHLTHIIEKLGPPRSAPPFEHEQVLWYSGPANDSDYWQVYFSCNSVQRCTKMVSYYTD